MNFGSYTNLTSLFTAIGNKLRKKVSFELVTQEEYNALVQAGTVDPNVDYHIYDADMTGAPIDDSTTAINKVWSSNKVNTELKARDELDAKNLLPNRATSQTINGVTFTVNADGIVDVSGTSTEYAGLTLVQPMSLKKGKYVLSGYGGTAEQGNIVVSWNNDNNRAWDAGNGAIVELSQDYDDIYSVIQVNANQTVNYTCYPMLRLASISDPTYMPYVRPNKDLAGKDQISNPNLLDNPWFTVNQRGITSWVTADGSGYKVDRFVCDAGNGSISNGVFVNDAPSYQKFEDSRIESLLGKVVTLSALNSDGTIASTTFTMPSSLPSSFTQYGAGIVVMVLKSGNESQVCRIASGHPVKAVKLELGSISTLHLDTAPNYATELLKCQRYFVNFNMNNLNNISIGYGCANGNTSIIYCNAYVPIIMRATPTISINGEIRLHGGGQVINEATYTPTFLRFCNTNFRFSFSDLPNAISDHVNYYVDFASSGSFSLSADL